MLSLVAAGLLAGVGVAVRARAALEGLRWLLDFLLAAGLLRLSASTGWTALATAAAIITVRQIAGLGLRARPSRRTHPQLRPARTNAADCP